jgi:hypothetical protein
MTILHRSIGTLVLGALLLGGCGGNAGRTPGAAVAVAAPPPLGSSGVPPGTCGGDFSQVGFRGGEPIPDAAGTPGLTFGPGRHVITHQIRLTDGMVLKGAGSDRTTLYFPEGMIGLGFPCNSLVDCWSWAGGVITASGAMIGIEGVTIAFPAHIFIHYGTNAGDQPGYDAVQFYRCTNCWANDVKVVNSDIGFITRQSSNITIDDTSVTANANGSHIHYAISEASTNVLVTDFTASGFSQHGLVIQWGAHGVYQNGTLSGGVPLEPNHNGPIAAGLYRNIHGDIGRIQKTARGGIPLNARFEDVNGQSFPPACAAQGVSVCASNPGTGMRQECTWSLGANLSRDCRLWGPSC